MVECLCLGFVGVVMCFEHVVKHVDCGIGIGMYGCLVSCSIDSCF